MSWRGTAILHAPTLSMTTSNGFWFHIASNTLVRCSQLLFNHQSCPIFFIVFSKPSLSQLMIEFWNLVVLVWWSLWTYKNQLRRSIPCLKLFVCLVWIELKVSAWWIPFSTSIKALGERSRFSDLSSLNSQWVLLFSWIGSIEMFSPNNGSSMLKCLELS